MTKIKWNSSGERLFETGLDRGVLYREGGQGVPWNGLVNVIEKTIGGTLTPYYLDGFLYMNDVSNASFGASLSAFSYPDEFAGCVGDLADGKGLYFGLQPHKEFHLSYRTLVGNDLKGDALGYKLHFVYNAKAKKTDLTRQTINATPNPASFSWDILGRPELVPDHKPTSHIFLDSREVAPAKLAQIEELLYGTASTYPRMLYPEELIAMT